MYNGHKNWTYWNVALWLANDESLYRWAKDVLAHHSRREAARVLKEGLPEKTPDGARYSIRSLYAALEDL